MKYPDSRAAEIALPVAVGANNAFAVDLFSNLLSQRSNTGATNLLTSPISASLALTMAYAGAVGSTATGMATALHLGSAAGSIFDGQNALSAAIASRASAALSAAAEDAKEFGAVAPSPSDYALALVSSVWGEQSYTWQNPFLNILAHSYGTGVYPQDFIHQFERARRNINTWVSSQTADKINDLIQQGSLDATARMVLVSAIHIKLPWDQAFDPLGTSPSMFTRADGTTVSASFMNQTLRVPYIDDGQAQIASLPLSGRQVSVIVALPHAGQDLETYEANLAVGSAALAQPTTPALVELSLPKATFTSPTVSLARALPAMGMSRAFDSNSADFSGSCAHPPDGSKLYIGDVLQKAMIAVQETGVEAAAATTTIVPQALSTEPTSAPTPMVVNRPYLIAIVDVPTGAILFLGHIEDPTDVGIP